MRRFVRVPDVAGTRSTRPAASPPQRPEHGHIGPRNLPAPPLWPYSGPAVPRPALRRSLPGLPRGLVIGVVLAVGCAGKGKGPPKPGEPGGPAEGAEEAAATMKSAMNVEPVAPKRQVALIPLAVNGQHCDASGKRVLQQDLNLDGRADLITLGGAEDGKIRCQQADLDNDGRLDAFLHYDARGDLVREQYDQDYDGRIDLGRTYKDGKIDLDEQDLDHDGYVDAWRRYDKGKLTRIDHDRDRDGRPDTFTFFVRGQIDRVGYDTNGDGNVDTWDQDVARRAQAALARRMQARAAVGDEFVEAPVEPPPEVKADPKAEEGKGKGGKGSKETGKAAKGKDAKAGDAGKDAKSTDAKAGDAGKDAKGKDASKDTKPGDAGKDAKPGASKPAGVAPGEPSPAKGKVKGDKPPGAGTPEAKSATPPK